MPVLTSTATCAAYRAVVEATGELVGPRLLAERVGWLVALVADFAGPLVAAHWADADLEVLAVGVGPDGRRLPSSGWMSLRRLGWTAAIPDGVVVSDRVRRVAEEAAARTLRLTVHRRGIVRALLATWPEDPRRRTDIQCFGPDTAELRVQLPLVPRPAGRADWAWHALPVGLPVAVPADADLCSPSLRVVKHRVRVDLPHRQPVPTVSPSGHTVALGLDWGWGRC